MSNRSLCVFIWNLVIFFWGEFGVLKDWVLTLLFFFLGRTEILIFCVFLVDPNHLGSIYVIEYKKQKKANGC